MLDISFLQVLDLKEKWDKYGRNWKKPDTASPYFLVQVLEMGSPVFFWRKWVLKWEFPFSVEYWMKSCRFSSDSSHSSNIQYFKWEVPKASQKMLNIVLFWEAGRYFPFLAAACHVVRTCRV
jgi:hypothetical protein